VPVDVVAEPVVADNKITIMVVDDSITIRKVTERMLNRYGIEVVLAKDGIDATNLLQENIPDLMLLDIEMPRMDGFEVASYVRNDERLKNVPIIMITSRTGSKHKEKAMEIGVNQYLGKPFQEDDLVNNINNILKTSF
jgi:chemosensory pili system protein ChpA (sensor histidine kinase/response regulator)